MQNSMTPSDHSARAGSTTARELALCADAGIFTAERLHLHAHEDKTIALQIITTVNKKKTKKRLLSGT